MSANEPMSNPAEVLRNLAALIRRADRAPVHSIADTRHETYARVIDEILRIWTAENPGRRADGIASTGQIAVYEDRANAPRAYVVEGRDPGSAFSHYLLLDLEDGWTITSDLRQAGWTIYESAHR